MNAPRRRTILRGRWLDGDAKFCRDRRELPDVRHAFGSGSVQLDEHLVEAATRRTQNEDARRLVANVADSMAPAARAEEEAARRDAAGRWLALKLNQKFAAQHIEGFILASMSVRRRTGARRNHGFPKREGAPSLDGRRLVDVGDAQHVERRTGCWLANERFGSCNLVIHFQPPWLVCLPRDRHFL